MIFLILAALLSGLGVICLISKRTLLGWLIGVQFLTLGVTLILVVTGVFSKAPIESSAFALFMIFGSLLQLVVGCSLALRFYCLKNKLGMDELKELRE